MNTVVNLYNKEERNLFIDWTLPNSAEGMCHQAQEYAGKNFYYSKNLEKHRYILNIIDSNYNGLYTMPPTPVDNVVIADRPYRDRKPERPKVSLSLYCTSQGSEVLGGTGAVLGISRSEAARTINSTKIRRTISQKKLSKESYIKLLMSRMELIDKLIPSFAAGMYAYEARRRLLLAFQIINNGYGNLDRFPHEFTLINTDGKRQHQGTADADGNTKCLTCGDEWCASVWSKLSASAAEKYAFTKVLESPNSRKPASQWASFSYYSNPWFESGYSYSNPKESELLRGIKERQIYLESYAEFLLNVLQKDSLKVRLAAAKMIG